MKDKIVERRVYIPALDKFYQAVVKALASSYCKFIENGLSLLPLPVWLEKTYAPVGRIIGVILILVKPRFLKSVYQTQNEGKHKDKSKNIFF
jgi:hypothetical protein